MGLGFACATASQAPGACGAAAVAPRAAAGRLAACLLAHARPARKGFVGRARVRCRAVAKQGSNQSLLHSNAPAVPRSHRPPPPRSRPLPHRPAEIQQPKKSGCPGRGQGPLPTHPQRPGSRYARHSTPPGYCWVAGLRQLRVNGRTHMLRLRVRAREAHAWPGLLLRVVRGVSAQAPKKTKQQENAGKGSKAAKGTLPAHPVPCAVRVWPPNPACA